jgi:predicted transposase/invertase (TIGR01784 family)
MQQYTVDIGKKMLTYAEELRQEGRQEGEIKGEIKTIDSLLSAGVEWTLITKATGITQQQFQILKEQLRQLSPSN